MTRQRLALGAALVLGAGVVLGWPLARAWWTFPAPDAAGVLAAFERGAQTHATFDALDAQGRTVTLTAERVVEAEPGACRARYGRSTSEDSRGVALHGQAVVRCRVDLTAEGHGPLVAVVEVLGDTALPRGQDGGARMLFADEIAVEVAR